MGPIPPSHSQLNKRRGRHNDLHLGSSPSDGITSSLESLSNVAPIHHSSSEGPFTMLRDSLVFNHERLLQTEASLASRLNHQNPSMTTLYNLEEEVVFDPETNEPQQVTKFSTTQENRENANQDRLPPPTTTWHDKHNFFDPRRVVHNTDLHLALEKVETERQMPYNEEVPLSESVESQTIPNYQQNASAPTVTTVYSYKCDRLNSGGGGESNLLGPTGGSEALMDIQEQYEPEDENNHVLQSKRNDMDIMTLPTSGDHATTDDDLDDFITSPSRQLQPFFPNPDELKWPDINFLRTTLPHEYHKFLETESKKDCRIWLWKNAKGRQARRLLSEYSANIASGGERVSGTVKAFTDDDFEEGGRKEDSAELIDQRKLQTAIIN